MFSSVQMRKKETIKQKTKILFRTIYIGNREKYLEMMIKIA